MQNVFNSISNHSIVLNSPNTVRKSNVSSGTQINVLNKSTNKIKMLHSSNKELHRVNIHIKKQRNGGINKPRNIANQGKPETQQGQHHVRYLSFMIDFSGLQKSLCSPIPLSPPVAAQITSLLSLFQFMPADFLTNIP